MDDHTIHRIKKIIRDIIKQLQIDLTSYTVLTEAGSEYYLFTPIIAALAGARKVLIWTRDSCFGKAEDIQNQFNAIIELFEIKDTKFVWAINDRPVEHIKQADIITNLGFVRPLNREFLSHIDSNKTVVPLMFEAWEVRSSDIDIDFCKQQNIKVAGTWENHPLLRIFDGCGPLAIKMANEAGYEVFKNDIIVWSGDHFGEIIEDAFLKYGARSVLKTININTLLGTIDTTDFIFVCNYGEERTIIGKNGIFDLAVFREKNPGIGIIHLYGNIDANHINEMGLNVYPNKNGKEMHMTFTFAHLGPILMINLHAAGFKVAQSILQNEESNLVQPMTY